MKKDYAQPAMQTNEMDMTCNILTGSNIGEGGEGQQGDVKGFGLLDDSDKENHFEENPFE